MKSSLAKYKNIIRKINQFEPEMEKLRGSDFAAKTAVLKMRFSSGDTLEKIMPEAFALVREAIKRQLGMRAFDVQLIGSLAAHEGLIAEMKTGEGKTLTIVFPSYLNALEGKGVHVVTANDYLAKRDALWMKNVYTLLGLNVDYITSQSSDFERQVAYGADVTYVTNNEVCFDYLKDNMVYDKKNVRHRGFHYAIVDEADSVLIDEAQIPLVIASNDKTSLKEKENFKNINKIIKFLKKKIDFTLDLKRQNVYLTIEGINKIERLINVENLYGQQSEDDYLYYVENLLKAYHLFKKDRDYVIDGNKAVIVNEYTGRLMMHHRYCLGIHQAIEAKEGIEIQDETEIMALTTFQHFFGHYEKIAGFTGTAATAEREFKLIYKKAVAIIPTNKPIARMDMSDRFFLNWQDKLDYLAWTAQEHFFKDRPMLIGTRSVKKSNQVQEALIAENIPSNVLNAKHTAREAEVISQAGQPSAVTVATNMAGRGTDIELHAKVKKLGGLVVFGTERHNARRIDNQLIGRCGRQGDPGMSQFLISADDELIKTHFKDEYERVFQKEKGNQEGIASNRLQKIVDKAQNRMQGVFMDQRILSYELDKVLEAQRQSFYRQRKRILDDDSLKKETLGLLKEELLRIFHREAPQSKLRISRGKLEIALGEVKKAINHPWFRPVFEKKNFYAILEVEKKIEESLEKYYADFEGYYGEKETRQLEKTVTLKVMDLLWIEHLKKAEELQEAMMVNSINDSGSYEEYTLRMTNVYKNMLFSVSAILCKTFFRTVNRIWKLKK